MNKLNVIFNKKIGLIALALILVFAFTAVGFANTITPDNILSKGTATDLMTKGDGGTILTNISSQTIALVKTIGVVCAIVILAIYGVQWFIGGPQQKATLKDRLWTYLFGAILCFAGPTVFFYIADLVASFTSK